MGVDVVMETIKQYSNKRIKDVHLLDGGCGTGNYSKALIQHGICKITMVDASQGMLDKAIHKLSRYIESGVVEDVKQSKLPELPFPDTKLDVVLFSLVLHHLESDNGNFKQLQSAVNNASNVLVDNGLLLIIAQTHTDLCNNWYCKLNPNITRNYCQRFAPEEVYERYFKAAGLKLLQSIKIRGQLMADHFRSDGPLDASWRNCDSFWTVASNDDMRAVEEKIKELKDDNMLEQWIQDNDRTSEDGCITLFVCKK
ncbi:hypothetical protein ACF0H5_023150 [Mactra antiquata]